jgi:hypothetical protein
LQRVARVVTSYLNEFLVQPLELVDESRVAIVTTTGEELEHRMVVCVEYNLDDQRLRLVGGGGFRPLEPANTLFRITQQLSRSYGAAGVGVREFAGTLLVEVVQYLDGEGEPSDQLVQQLLERTLTASAFVGAETLRANLVASGLVEEVASHVALEAYVDYVPLLDLYGLASLDPDLYAEGGTDEEAP